MIYPIGLDLALRTHLGPPTRAARAARAADEGRTGQPLQTDTVARRWDLGFDSVVYSETIADKGYWTSLAIASTDVTCVAFQDGNTADLKYVCRDDASSAWTVSIVNAPGDVGSYAQLAFNSADEPYIAYYDATNDDLNVATLQNGSWTVLRVDATGDFGQTPSIAVGPDDRVHVSYYDVTNGALKYAVGGCGTPQRPAAAPTVGALSAPTSPG